MKTLSLFIAYFIQQALVEAAETEDTAKQHCEEYFVDQGENIDKINFNYLTSGTQTDVYKCESLSGNYDPSVVAVKIFQRPWEFNVTEREIIDTAMGNVDVGPKIYQYLPTGRIEQFLDNMRTFPWTNPDGNEDDWGHGGCFECAEEEVANQTAILMARLHLAYQTETDLNLIPERYETQIWPWNTRLVYDHLSQPWMTENGQERAIARRLGISASQMRDEWRWIQSLYEDDSDLEISLCHNDIHLENMMVAEGSYSAETHMLIDFDNGAWGYRGFDFNYHFEQFPRFPNDDELKMFLESYQKEYRRICNDLGTCQEPSLAQLEHDVRKTRPYGNMRRLLHVKTLTLLIWDKDIESYIESLKYFNRELGTPYP